MLRFAFKSKLISSGAIFTSWAFFRFFFMGQIRRTLVGNFHLAGSAKVFTNHALIVAEACLIASIYLYFRRRDEVSAINYGRFTKLTVTVGIISGIVIFFVTIPVALYFGMNWHFHFSPVDAFGNLFSNAAEEVIYRGILFAGAKSLFRSDRVGVVVSAMAFGLGHWDVPLLFQTYIAFVGIVLGVLYLRTKSLVAPYIAHTVADLVADLLLG